LGNRQSHGSTGQVGLCRPDFPGSFFGLLFLVSERLCPSLPPDLGTLFKFSKNGKKAVVDVTQSIHVLNLWYLAWGVVNQAPPTFRLVQRVSTPLLCVLHHASFSVANAAQVCINVRRRSNRSVLK
jgi:polyferredoxin